MGAGRKREKYNLLFPHLYLYINDMQFLYIFRCRQSVSSGDGGVANEKPFACPVPGCKKRYKNVNGIKYHSKNGHKKDGKYVEISNEI